MYYKGINVVSFFIFVINCDRYYLFIIIFFFYDSTPILVTVMDTQTLFSPYPSRVPHKEGKFFQIFLPFEFDITYSFTTGINRGI